MWTPPAILVVDDEKDHCLNLADILCEHSYSVDVANGGRDALRLMEDHRYDLVLLDLAMPGMDGLTLYRKIKGLLPELSACFITADPRSELADEVRASRAGPILAKPLDVPRLLYWIDGALGGRGGGRSPSRGPSYGIN